VVGLAVMVRGERLAVRIREMRGDDGAVLRVRPVGSTETRPASARPSRSMSPTRSMYQTRARFLSAGK
jgi:hypothetical protein